MLKVKKIRSLTIILLLITVLYLFFFDESLQNLGVSYKFEHIKLPEKNSKILVFAPHPDDEVLAAYGLIKKTLENGGKVKIIFITNGEAHVNALRFVYFKFNPKPSDYINLGYIRQQESISVFKKIGLTNEDFIFLGYPDKGVSQLWDSNKDSHHKYISIYTKSSESPFINTYNKNSSYTGSSLINDISNIVKEFQPTYIIYPHLEDSSSDHKYTYHFIKYSFYLINYKPENELLYLIHYKNWPSPMMKMTNLYMLPPAGLAASSKWYTLELDKTDIFDKSLAVSLFKSSLRTAGPFLNSFIRKNELFCSFENKHILEGTMNN